MAESVITNLPPQNLEAEGAVLGALLVNKEAMDKVADILVHQDFYQESHQTIYRAILRLFEKRSPIDLVTLTNELDSLKELDAVGGAAKLAELVNTVPTAIHVEHYAQIVKHKSVLRRILAAGQQIARLGMAEDKEIQEILDESESALFGVSRQLLKDNFQPISDILASSFDRIDRLHREKGLLRGVPTGFKDLDNKLSGLQPSDLVILAARPSMGKCVSGDTEILDPKTGQIKTIRNLVNEGSGQVVTLTDDWQFDSVQPDRFVSDGIKPTFKVVTALGRQVEATLPHPFLTVRGWKQLAELAIGERIAVPKRLPYFGQTDWLAEKIKLLAYYIAEGGLTQNTPRFTSQHPKITADFINSIQKFAPLVSVRKIDDDQRTPSYVARVSRLEYRQERLNWTANFARYQASNTKVVYRHIRALGLSASNVCQWQNGSAQPSKQVYLQLKTRLPDLPVPTCFYRHNPITDLLKEHGLWGKSASQKVIPQEVFGLTKSKLALFLNRLFSCDGSAYVANCGGKDFPVISYASSSLRLIHQVQHLLTRFGVLALVRRKNVKYRGGHRTAYELEIHGKEDLLVFIKEISIFGKEEALAKVKKAVMTTKKGYTKDTLPIEIWAKIVAAKGERSWRSIHRQLGLPEGTNLHAFRRSPRRETVLKIAAALGNEELKQIASGQIYWDRIVAIIPTGMKEVFDLTIAQTHNFVANDIVVHNTTLALNIALNAAVKGQVPVAFFSMEQSKEQIVDRLICAQAMVDGWKLRTGNLSEDDFPAIGMAMGTLAEAQLYIDDSPMMTPIEIRTKARRLRAEKELGLIIVDYLQLLESNRGGSRENNRVQEVSDISRSLKALARELNVPVVALSQLSRAVEGRERKIPQLSDLRESGCLTGDTEIVRADTGEVVTIKELANRPEQTPLPVFSLDQDNRLVAQTMTKAFYSGRKMTYQLTTQSGRTIKASANHPFRKINGWHRLDQLTVGDHLALPRLLNVNSDRSKLKQDELILLAHLLGDGCVLPRQPIHYTSADPANLEVVGQAAVKLFGIQPCLVRQKNWWHLYLPSPYRLARGRHHPIVNWFKDLGIDSVRSYQKVIPGVMSSSGSSGIALFLHHLWATDGNISWKFLPNRQKAGAIYYASSSRKLAGSVQHLLLRLGINSTLRVVPQRKGRTNYHVQIQGRDQQLLFLELVGCYGQRGQIIHDLKQALKKINSNPNNDIIPQEAWKEIVEPAKISAGQSWRSLSASAGWQYSGSSLFQSGIGRERMRHLADVLGNSSLMSMAESDIYWDKIVAITPIGIADVYDATVPETHNFVANDIIVHNSIEQDADVVIFLYREDYYDKDTERKGITDLLIRKHRNGPIGEVELLFKAEQARFYDIERRVKTNA